METTSFKEQLGFQRAISVSSDKDNLSESQLAVIEQVKDFGIDEVYFCTDENNSYPAVFLKEIICFDENTLKCIAQIHRKVWNYKKILFLYVYNDTEIRIYNCVEKPFVETKITDYESELNKLEIKRATISDVNKLSDLNKVFSSISIDTGIIWTLEDALEIRNKINLQRRVDKYLVDSLIKTGKSLQEDGLNDIDIIHKLMMRSLFLLYLEDRGATDANFYANINRNASSYFDILNNVDDTFSLFKKLEKHFNGNVFSLAENEQKYVTKNHLKLIKQCFISGYEGSDIVQLSLFEDWRLFNFQIIQIELLSEIYENFLSEIDPSQKQQTGTFYTPPSLVELILNEKLPVNKNDKNYDIKVLDPACGSGIFLVESFKRLVKRYENKHGEKLTDFEELKKLLTDNIFGIEITPQSIKVAAFSLYLALLDNLNPKTLWQYRILPYLINDPETIPENKQGKNLYRRDTIETNEEIEEIEFDLVVGNPPFGTENKPNKILPESIRTYCDDQSFAKEMVLPFLHKAIKFSPKGEIAMIFNTKVLTNTGSTYQNFRKWLFNDCYVEKLYNFSILRNTPRNFGGQLFGSAIGPISIVFYKNETPKENSERIVYYAPKTYLKTNILEGVVIDSSDVKYLPREECQKPNTKIWKIAMWGGDLDMALINRLSNIVNNIKTFLSNNDILFGVGLQPLNESTINPIIDNDISQMKFIRPERINRYYTSTDLFSNINSLLKDKKTIDKYLEYYKKENVDDLPAINIFRRLGAKEVYLSPMLLVKDGFKNNKICASYIDTGVAYNSSVLGFSSKDVNHLRVLSALLNSNLASYFLLMISSSWGIERERIKPNEVYTFPYSVDEESFSKIALIHENIENALKSDFINTNVINNLEIEINKLISSQYKISNKENILINDFLNISVDILYKKEKAKAFFPVLSTKKYSITLCEELNDFLESQNIFANATIYPLTNQFAPLVMIKVTFDGLKKDITESVEDINNELKRIDNELWIKKAGNLYFRKKLNYKDGDDVFLVRPNQRRFWSQTMAMEDASELILEILNED